MAIFAVIFLLNREIIWSGLSDLFSRLLFTGNLAVHDSSSEPRCQLMHSGVGVCDGADVGVIVGAAVGVPVGAAEGAGVGRAVRLGATDG